MRHLYQGTFKDLNGAVIGSLTTSDNNAGTVSVYLAGTTTAASVYENLTTPPGGEVAVSSVSTDTYGHFTFYVDDSVYSPSQLFKITLSHTDVESKSYDYIKIIPDDPYKYYIDATVTDQGSVSTAGDRSLKDRIDISATIKTDVVFTNSGGGNTTTYTLTTSDTVTDNIFLNFENGAIIDGAGTLTLDRPEQINAMPGQQIFGSSITVVFSNGGTVHPGWWGDFTSAAVNAAATSLDGVGGDVVCLSDTYTITTLITIPRGVSLIGTHTPSQLSPVDVLTAEGTIFNRTADIGVLSLVGAAATVTRYGSNTIKGIAFVDDLDISDADTIYSKWTNNVFVEKCTFFQEDASATVGHQIDLVQCWDWKIRKNVFKGYGNTGGTKFAINIANDATSYSNHIAVVENQFGNGNGSAVFSDATGAGSIRNSFIDIYGNKFEDNTVATVQPFIKGEFSHVFIDRNFFVGNDEAHIVCGTVCEDVSITNNQFSSLGDTATEYLDLSTVQRSRVIENHFNGVGAATTSYIKATGSVTSNKAGGSTDGLVITNNTFYETVLGTTDMFTWTGYIYYNVIVKNNTYQNETVTAGSPALLVFDGYTELNSNGGAITATLGDGIRIGDIKTIVMSEATTSSTVTIAKLDNENGIPSTAGLGGDGEVATFDALDETWVGIWTGTEWTTLRATCTFV